MLARLISFFLLLIVAGLLWLANTEYPHESLQKGFYTFVVFSAVFFFFKLILEESVSKKIKEPRARYSFRKTISLLYMVVLLIAIITIWVPNPEALLVAYGLVAAGIAIAMQDLFKNVAGGLILLFMKLYRVGDRIEIGSSYGDVIDIDIMYTTLLEIRQWVDGDQATGRLVVVPNGGIISGTVKNYTKDNNFIWDEIWVPITYGSDWRKASSILADVAKKETRETAQKAQKEMSKIQEKYYLSGRQVDPKVFMVLTDNWISLSLRYVTDVRERRAVNAKLQKLILDKFEKSKNIKIASSTTEIVGFPEVRVKQKR